MSGTLEIPTMKYPLKLNCKILYRCRGGSWISQTGGEGVSVLLPPANEVWGKVICLQVCVCPLRGCLVPGGCLVQGVAGPGGWLVRGCLVWGVLVPSPGWVPGGDPPRQILLRAVHIILECILVLKNVCQKLHENKRNWTEGEGDASPKPPPPPGFANDVPCQSK